MCDPNDDPIPRHPRDVKKGQKPAMRCLRGVIPIKAKLAQPQNGRTNLRSPISPQHTTKTVHWQGKLDEIHSNRTQSNQAASDASKNPTSLHQDQKIQEPTLIKRTPYRRRIPPRTHLEEKRKHTYSTVPHNPHTIVFLSPIHP